MRSTFPTSVFLATVLLIAPSAWALSKSEAAIAERISPAGKVCVEGDMSCAKAAATTTASAGPRAAEDIYTKVCLGCHDTGAAGAPKRGDAAAWNARLEKGMDTLVSNAINGINAMPPKGLCMDCSDEEIRIVVEYLVKDGQ